MWPYGLASLSNSTQKQRSAESRNVMGEKEQPGPFSGDLLRLAVKQNSTCNEERSVTYITSGKWIWLPGIRSG